MDSEYIHVVNTITVPPGMEAVAEETRALYVDYFSRQTGFVGSTFLKATSRESDGAIRYVNTVIWASQAHFDAVVNSAASRPNSPDYSISWAPPKRLNRGFDNVDGENADGLRVLGKGFPAPIVVSPGRYTQIA